MIPQTGFEASGESRYTTRTEEETFLQTLHQETSANLTVEGYSVMGAPIWCLEIGQGSTVLVVANVHAGEPCGRDAALSWVRDMAYSTDPQVIDYLESHRVAVIPNVNIDGSARPWQRDNANGVNLNRDYISLREPESRAVARVAQRVQPVLIMDMHMVGDDQGAAWRPYWNAPHDGHPDLLTLAEEFVDETASTLAEQGYTTLNYDTTLIPWGGLSTIAPAWHAAGILNEVAYLPGGVAENVAVARTTLDQLTEFHQEKRARLDAARAASLATRRQGSIRVPTHERLNRGEAVTVPASGQYTISGTPAQELLELHGITRSGQTVTLDQPAQLMACYLLSPESSEHILNLEDWAPSPEGAPATESDDQATPLSWVRQGSQLHPVKDVYAHQSGVIKPVHQIIAKQNGVLLPII